MDFNSMTKPSGRGIFSELGKLLLMFSAGLEIDLALFRKVRNKSYVFGILTTTLPLLLGTAVGLLFGYALVPALVIGSLLASHTLLALPVLSRLGETRLEPMVITVSATVTSDSLSLLAGVFRNRFPVVHGCRS